MAKCSKCRALAWLPSVAVAGGAGLAVFVPQGWAVVTNVMWDPSQTRLGSDGGGVWNNITPDWTYLGVDQTFGSEIDTANFGAGASGNYSVNLAGGGIISAGITYKSGPSYTINGTNTLSLSNAGTDAITLNSGVNNPQYISVPVSILDSFYIYNNSSTVAATFSMSGSVMLASGVVLNLAGSNAGVNSISGNISGSAAEVAIQGGTWQLGGNNTYSGGTVVNAGQLEVVASGSLPGGNSVTNNTGLKFDGVQNLGSISGNGTTTVGSAGMLTVGNVTQAVLANSGITQINGNSSIDRLTGNGSLRIGNGTSNNTVQLAAAGTPNSVNNTQQAMVIASGSKLDISNNTLLLNYGNGSTPLAAVQAAVAGGEIFSSTANAGNPGQYAVGYADSTELASIPSGEVKVMYTLAGDANLDGMVNFNDFSILQNNYDQSGCDWAQGDFNHDGVVNFNDFSILQNNYDTSIAADNISDGVMDIAKFRRSDAGTIVAVPEPACISILLGGLSLLVRRRGRRLSERMRG